MTREEAVEHLDTIGQYYSQDHSDPYDECERLTKDELDAIYLAIKALEQEPCISKQVLKEQMIKYGFHASDMTVTEFVEDLPPINSQELYDDAINRIFKRMWNCRGKHTTNIDKIKMEQIIRDELPVHPQPKTGHWIPVKFRPLTNEEQEEYPDYCYMADCPMPDDGEEILVSTKYGTVEKDECGFDDGYYLDSGYDWQTDIAAWMQLPKPYEPQESEDKE